MCRLLFARDVQTYTLPPKNMFYYKKHAGAVGLWDVKRHSELITLLLLKAKYYMDKDINIMI